MPPKNVRPTGRKMEEPAPIKLKGKLTRSREFSSGHLTGSDKTEIEDYSGARVVIDAKIKARKETRKE